MEEAPVEGTLEDCPQAAGAHEYAVGAQGPGGRNYAVTTLRVIESAAAGAHAPGTQEGRPTIDLFSVLPGQLAIGECAELRWTVGGAVSNIRIERDGVVVVEGAPRSGSGTDCPSEPGLLHYRIWAADKQGQIDSTEVEIGVGAPSPTATPTPAAAVPAPTVADTPVGRQYVLIAYRDAAGAMASPLTGTRITALFGAEDKLSGDGGCNTYGSTYQLNGNQLTTAPIAGTEKFCSEPIGIMDQEVQYLSALQTVATYTLDGGLLTLLDGAGNQVAVFVAAQ